MKTHLYIIVAFSTIVAFSEISFAQSKKVKEYLKQQDEKLMKDFPPPLKENYPNGSLGEKIQTLYQLQAESACGIKRNDSRLFIPSEIVNAYGQNRLKSTYIYDIQISAKNLLFLALTSDDIKQINEGTFNENVYVNAKRVIGIKDNLVNYGQAILTPIDGFPSLFYQKSCGSYFVGDLGAQVKAPVAELEASLKAETNKTTSITTITGKFFSPLYLIFRQNTVQSIYAHLLLWEVYSEQSKSETDSNKLLINSGKYISEFNGTLTNRSIDSYQSLNMNGRLSANISSGIVSINGNIQAGYEDKVSFSLKDFNTSIHKLSADKLSYATSELPNITVINQKLQNSLNFKAQPSLDGFVCHLLPIEISRILTGIPAFLCDKGSWIVSDNGYDKNLWEGKPQVSSIHTITKEGEYPDCVCKITGYIKKLAIDEASNDRGTLEIKMTLENNITVNGKKLVLNIYEPSIKVTNAPKILSINSESINAARKVVTSSNTKNYCFPIQFLIDDTGVDLVRPYNISNLQIEFVNIEQLNQLNLQSLNPIVNGNSVSIIAETIEKPNSYIQEGELSVPIKIKFSIQLRNGSTTQLVTNTINLLIPNLVEKIKAETKFETPNF